MTNQLHIHRVPYLILGCGGVGAALRYWMYMSAVDEKGLLRSGNLQLILLLILTAAVAVLTWVTVRKMDGSNRFTANFPPSMLGGATSMLAALGTLTTLPVDRIGTLGRLEMSWLVIGLLSIPGMAVAGLFRAQGKRPPFYCHGIACVFFGLHLANQYRLWSGNPEIMDYCFQLFASVGLMVAAYHHTAFDVGLGRRQLQLATNLLTAFCCFVCVSDLEMGLFYLSWGLWCLANLCALVPPPRRRREVRQE